MLRPSWWSEDRAVRAPSEPDPDIDADWVDTTPPPDPARIAAAIMIGEALERTGTTVETAARDGDVIFIQSPDASWTAPIHEQWSAWIRGGEAAWDLSGTSAFRGRGAFSSFAPTQRPSDGELAHLAQRFQLALAAGEQCLGVAHDRAWMPDDLLDAVDLELRCLPLNDDELSEVVQVMTGVAPTERLDPGVASTVTPRQLRLCRRVSQEADGYMRKLAQLVKVEAARKRNTVPTSCSSAPRTVARSRTPARDGGGRRVGLRPGARPRRLQGRPDPVGGRRLRSAAVRAAGNREDPVRPGARGDLRASRWWWARTGSGSAPGRDTRAT